jgi:hypothetical protein
VAGAAKSALALGLNSRSRVRETRLNILNRQPGICTKEIVEVWVLRQMPKNERHRNARPAHHRLSDHDVGILRNAIKLLSSSFYHKRSAPLGDFILS